jgi:Fur family peroxide stress response transcriptional regulator
MKKRSHKRDAVMEKLQSTKTHPSALWIYDELRKEIPDLSLGTVYRNLSIFKDEGRVISVGVVGGQERYDANTKEHTHFICLGCGDVIDVDADADPAIKKDIESRYGFDVQMQQLTFYGRCIKCRESR